MEKGKLWDIKPEPSEEYELRLTVYDTENVPCEDIEGTSDVFVKAWFDEKHKRETETHWRCTTGEASLNYRLLFHFQCPHPRIPPHEAYKLKLQILDRDIIGSNTVLTEYELDLRLLMEDCKLTGKLMHLNKAYFNQYFGKASELSER